MPVGIGVDDGGLDDVVEGDEVVGKGQPRHKLGERILPRAEEEVGEEHVGGAEHGDGRRDEGQERDEIRLLPREMGLTEFESHPLSQHPAVSPYSRDDVDDLGPITLSREPRD